MRLNFGIEIDTKGLPEVFSVRAQPSYTADHGVNVSVFLDSVERSAVEAWAKYLGVEVVDREPYQVIPGDRWTHVFEAVREVEGYRIRVWTAASVKAQDAVECPCGCTAAFCRCTDPQTCSCTPVCPVCDQDGGE